MTMSNGAMKKVSKFLPMPVRAPGRLLGRPLARDEGGAIAVIFALMLTALLGMMALAVDLGKAWNLETQLQHAADACALVAVTQLDGADGARARAIQAAFSQLANNEQGGFARDSVDADSDGIADGLDVNFDTNITIGGDGTANNRDIKFYTQVPLDPANIATSDAEARFAECNVLPRTAPFSFALLVGGPSSASPGARAVAGWETLFCDSPVMMMCNPDEDPAGDADATFNMYTSCPDDGDGTSCVGRGITMKARAGAPEPGDFGYLALSVVGQDGTVETVDGAAQLKDALADVDYSAVCTGNKVTTEPGNIASLDQYINQRFDLYPTLAEAIDANRQPSPNVGRGLVTKATFDPANGKCKYAPQTPADPGDWKKPRNAVTNELENYRGPGMHEMVDTDSDGVADVSQFDAAMGEVDSPIRAMAYPKDACNYLPVDTDETVYGPVIGGGPAGCLFKVPPGNPGVPQGRQMGTAQWDIQIYLDVYHPDWDEAALIADGADAPNSINPPIGPDGKISRWELYSWEKEYDAVTDSYPNMAFEEEPVCYRAGELFPDNYSLPEPPASASKPDRRIMVMAVINCAAMGGGKRTVERTEPHRNVAVFLTEPMGYTVPDTLFGELVDPMGLGLGNVDETPTLIRERIVLIE